MKPFRFGVSVIHAASREEWVTKARKAEDLGFSVLTTPDDLAQTSPPMLPLITAAEATTKLRVGTLVLNNDLRHPVVLAREAAMVDLLTGGRFELGMGAGHSFTEYAEVGVRFDPGPVRVARLAESVGLVRELFGGDPVTFAGEHYRVTGHRIGMPLREGGPPLLIGGHARSLLRLAGREADIVGFTGLGRTLEDGQRHEPTGFRNETIAERVTLVRQAAGERFERLELNALVQTVLLTNNRWAAAEQLAERLAPLTARDILKSPFLLVGTAEQMAEDLEERRATLGLTYISVFEHSMEAMARVIGHL